MFNKFMKEKFDMDKINNIFDLENTDDIPIEIKKIILKNKKKISNISAAIIEMFQLKNELSITEIAVGIYRLHNIAVPKLKISSFLYVLKKKKIIYKEGNKFIWIKNE